MNNEYEDTKKEVYKKLDDFIETYMEAAAFADNFLKYYNEKYGEDRPDIDDNKSQGVSGGCGHPPLQFYANIHNFSVRKGFIPSATERINALPTICDLVHG